MSFSNNEFVKDNIKNAAHQLICMEYEHNTFAKFIIIVASEDGKEIIRKTNCNELEILGLLEKVKGTL